MLHRVARHVAHALRGKLGAQPHEGLHDCLLEIEGLRRDGAEIGRRLHVPDAAPVWRRPRRRHARKEKLAQDGLRAESEESPLHHWVDRSGCAATSFAVRHATNALGPFWTTVAGMSGATAAGTVGRWSISPNIGCTGPAIGGGSNAAGGMATSDRLAELQQV